MCLQYFLGYEVCDLRYYADLNKISEKLMILFSLCVSGKAREVLAAACMVDLSSGSWEK